jgi:hypothetical protein
MMKAEMEDAFKVRKWVLVFLVVSGAVGAMCGVAVFRWAVWGLRNWNWEG